MNKKYLMMESTVIFNPWQEMQKQGQEAKPLNEYTERVSSKLIDIVAEEKQVSEKAHNAYGQIMNNVKELVHHHDTQNIIREFANQSKRPQFCAEHLFDKLKIQM
jgi:hypothetical protein